MDTIQPTSAIRPLFIDFDLYTDGDTDFKVQLISLMIENLQELCKSLQLAYSQNDTNIFKKTYHKVKPTVSMLNDAELEKSIEELHDHILPESVSTLNKICDLIIKSLKNENKKS